MPDPTRPVVVVGALPQHAPPGLEALAGQAELRYADTVPGLRAALAGARVVLVWDFESTLLREGWAWADRLEWVHVAGAGVDRVLFPELVESDVVLTNARGIFDEPIAEYVLGLMLVFAKDLRTTLDLQREHRWSHRETERLEGKIVLVVGAGGIGRAIGRRVRCLGMRAAGVATRARDDDPDFERVVVSDGLDEVLPEADFVVLALPLTPETEGMFGREHLGRMKPSARLINVGRGGLVDEEALVEALRSGSLAGAALDVFRQEPLVPHHPLWDLPQVIVSPHMSGDFVGWREALVDQFADNFRRWSEGRPLRNVVDKRRGYVPTTGERA